MKRSKFVLSSQPHRLYFHKYFYSLRVEMAQQATSSTPVDTDAIAPPLYTAKANAETPTDEKIAIEFVFPR